MDMKNFYERLFSFGPDEELIISAAVSLWRAQFDAYCSAIEEKTGSPLTEREIELTATVFLSGFTQGVKVERMSEEFAQIISTLQN